MCGEKLQAMSQKRCTKGSPPRVRGKEEDEHAKGQAHGITPACAGKSPDAPSLCVAPLGSPPRVRGKDTRLRKDLERMGITPACAGKSLVGLPLRCLAPGSPPRVRGKVVQFRPCPLPSRITPACAGKSFTLCVFWPFSGDHPRVCGEKQSSGMPTPQQPGSPPRVRGKVSVFTSTEITYGITPACAGKSICFRARQCVRKDHPRVCGEKIYSVRDNIAEQGSPPRVRGKDDFVKALLLKPGITPACAGKRR